MPKKTNDIEKRLEALENRQNMFPGGLVDLGNINLPTSYFDPNTGKTMPMPTLNPYTLNTTNNQNNTTNNQNNTTLTREQLLAQDAAVNDPFGAMAKNALMKDVGTGTNVFTPEGAGDDFSSAVSANNPLLTQALKTAGAEETDTASEVAEIVKNLDDDTTKKKDDDDDTTKKKEDDDTVKKDAAVINRINNGDGTFTIVYSDGSTEILGTPLKTVANTIANGDGTITIVYSDGSTEEVGTPITIPTGGGGSGAETGGTGGPTNYGDVQAQFDQMAGLTGLNPALPPGANVAPAMDIQPQPGEFETTAGIQLGAAPSAGTQVVSDEQIAALNAAGYTISPLSKQASNTDTLTPITNQVLTAQTKDNLLREVTGQSGTLGTESVIGTAPQAESITVKKADAPSTNDVAEVSRRGTPSVDDFVGTYGDKIQAAKRSMDVGDTVPELDPQTANQATAQVQYEKTAEATMQAAQATADERTRTMAQAVEQEMSQVPVEATVQGQLENLMAQFADGKTPAYAAGAIRNAQAMMAQRGLSASSMAGAAIMQAAMESSIPIAAQDAQVFREINLSNINNKQKVALANQAAALNLSLADLNNRQQTALQNSTNGFKLQSQSLSNMQQTALANAQLRAALQDRELAFDQQRAITNAAKYTEIENINLSNEQQGVMQDSVNNINFAMSNLSFQQQRRLSKAQVDAALTGQELSADVQRAVINAARVAEVNNIKFTEEQTRNLNDAQIMQNLTLANLDADMKAALSDAASYATMDMANLNNRQQAQVINAQSFLNLDLTNLSNKQQGEVLKYQARTNALFSDAAADNARNQFNAQSENQVNQFFAQLGAQVAQQNAQRVAAMKQFNVDQVNSHARFNSSLTDNREKFNSTMQAQINQSNAQWRRQTNTVNTATQNEANRIDALNLLNMNQNSLNSLWQAYRDEASWLFTENMTVKQYAHEIAKMNLNAQQQRALYNLQVKGDAVESIGTVIVDAALGV